MLRSVTYSSGCESVPSAFQKSAAFLDWLSNYQLVIKQGVLGRDISSSYSSTVNKPYKRDEERSNVAAHYDDKYSNEHLRNCCFQIQTLPVKFKISRR